MWSCPDNMPNYYPGLRDILPSQNVSQIWVIFWHIIWTRPHSYHYYTECLIIQVICQNITEPNITTETYMKYNNNHYKVQTKQKL